MACFADSVSDICERIREKITIRPASESAAVADLLNEVIQAELTCVARYRHEYQFARTQHGESAAAGFLEYAAEEQGHVDRVSARLNQLGYQASLAAPPFATWVNQQTESTADRLEDLAQEDLLAEGIIVDTYGKLADWLSTSDPETATLIRQIQAEEASHMGE